MHFLFKMLFIAIKWYFCENSVFLQTKFLNHCKTHNEKTIDHAKFHTKP